MCSVGRELHREPGINRDSKGLIRNPMQAIRLGRDFQIGREKVPCKGIKSRLAQNGMGNEGCRSKAQGLYLISVRVTHWILVKFP